jgi:hypothetical protein
MYARTHEPPPPHTHTHAHTHTLLHYTCTIIQVFSGDYVINGTGGQVVDVASHVAALRGVGVIAGSLIVEGTSITDTDLADVLANVRTVTGVVAIDNTTRLSTLTVLLRMSVGALSLTGNEALVSFEGVAAIAGTNLIPSSGRLVTVAGNPALERVCGVDTNGEVYLHDNPRLRRVASGLQRASLFAHDCTRGRLDLLEGAGTRYGTRP